MTRKALVILITVVIFASLLAIFFQPPSASFSPRTFIHSVYTISPATEHITFTGDFIHLTTKENFYHEVIYYDPHGMRTIFRSICNEADCRIDATLPKGDYYFKSDNDSPIVVIIASEKPATIEIKPGSHPREVN